MAVLYRATVTPLVLNEALPAPTYALSSFSELRRPAEQLLGKRRPPERPSRLSSWFACDTPGNAARYLEGQRHLEPERFEGPAYVYKLKAKNWTKHPMCLLDAVASKLSKGEKEVAEALADEYWTPTQNWGFWEYLCPEIVVLDTLPWPTAIERWMAQFTYEADRKTRDKLVAALATHSDSKTEN